MTRVLLVEDDRSIEQLLTQALRVEGFEVACERDGPGAVAAFTRDGADALVLDVMLPGMNGFQVAERVRNHPLGAEIPIIMVSGIYRGAQIHASALQRFSLAAYVEKPFQLDEILEPLRAALSRARPRREEGPGTRASPSEATARTARLALRSNTRERSLPWVLGELLRRRATGVLLVCRGRRDSLAVYFREGSPVGLRSRRRDHWLPTALLRARVLHEGDVGEVLRRARREGPFAELLVKLGYVSPAALQQVEHRRLEGAIADALGWTHAELRFYVRERQPAGLPRVAPPALALLYRCTQEGWSAVELARELASRLDERPQAAREASPQLWQQLPERERALLWSLDGTRTVRELVAARPHEDTAALLLTGLSAGLVAPHDVPTAPRPAPAAPRPDAYAPPAPAAPPRRAAPAAAERATLDTRVGAARAEARTASERRDDPTQLAELRERAEALVQADHWAALGVSRGAEGATLRAAYHRLAKRYHPDRFALAGPETQALADKLFARFADAHRVLSDPELTRQYEEEGRRSPAETNAAEQVARVVGAEKAFHEGEQQLKRHSYDAAVARFEEAVRLYPDEGEYHAYLGYALSLARAGDATSQRRAAAELAQAKQLSPRCARAFLFQGYLHKTSGRLDLAEREFRAAAELDGREVEAARELRLLALRRERSAAQEKKRQ